MLMLVSYGVLRLANLPLTMELCRAHGLLCLHNVFVGMTSLLAAWSFIVCAQVDLIKIYQACGDVCSM